MARMIPNVDHDGIENGSERSTYIALRDGLPKRYTVFHSYPWLRLWRGDREKALFEGEADFVILHPDKGLLVLELKGGEVFSKDGLWFRHTRAGPKAIRNPFEQARWNMHALTDIVRDYSHHQLKPEDYIHGYAVIFPDVDYEGRPPAYADRAIIICQRHLHHIQDSIDEAFRRWTAAPKPLAQARYDLLVSSLMPTFQFIRPIGPDIAAAAERIYMLTESQAEAYQGMLQGCTRALVEGPAGSGKTELALRVAVHLAASGKRALVLCFNWNLADWLRERVQADPTLSEETKARCDIVHFHGLARRLAERAGVAFKAKDGKVTQRFYDEEAPDILSQAVSVLEGRGEDHRYDAAVVDEAQDFAPLWWFSILEDLVRAKESPLYVFLDPNQSLRGTTTRPDIGLPPPIHLSTNCRNTKRIATFASRLLDLEAKSFRFAPEGPPVTVVQARRQDDQRGLVEQRVERLLSVCKLTPKQIAIIGPAAKESGSLHAANAIAGVPVVTAAAEWRAGKGMLVTTARSFKGLEADVVVAYDLGSFGELFTETDLYVACTRAIYLLEAVVHDDRIGGRLRRAASD